MRKIFRHTLITMCALWITAQFLPSFIYEGGIHTLLVGAIVFLLINILIVPLIKVMLLPLNLLTLGLFSWLANVFGLYVLTLLLPKFKVLPYTFPGVTLNGFVIPQIHLNVFEVVVLASLLIGFVTNLLKWVTD